MSSYKKTLLMSAVCGCGVFHLYELEVDSFDETHMDEDAISRAGVKWAKELTDQGWMPNEEGLVCPYCYQDGVSVIALAVESK
jgi:hypothetical protein